MMVVERMKIVERWMRGRQNSKGENIYSWLWRSDDLKVPRGSFEQGAFLLSPGDNDCGREDEGGGGMDEDSGEVDDKDGERNKEKTEGESIDSYWW